MFLFHQQVVKCIMTLTLKSVSLFLLFFFLLLCVFCRGVFTSVHQRSLDLKVVFITLYLPQSISSLPLSQVFSPAFFSPPICLSVSLFSLLLPPFFFIFITSTSLFLSFFLIYLSLALLPLYLQHC